MNLLSLIFLVMVFTLSGCTTVKKSTITQQDLPHYYNVNEPIQCVPYARDISGISIYGDAHTWWGAAAGRYQRGHVPALGAVLVLSKTSHLKYGHLAVVKRVVDARTIEVAHSNWGYNRETRCVNYHRMPVRDVSVNNDWSKVRFWDYPSGTYGKVYPVSGFIYPHSLQ